MQEHKVVHTDTVYDYDFENDMVIVCRQNEIEQCDECGKLFPLRKKHIVGDEILCPDCFNELGEYSVGKGWWSLLDEAQEKLKKQGAKIIEYKEKYGVLRIYTDIANDEIHKITNDIEKQSSHICEFCGKEGHTVEMKNGLAGWLKTVCSDCAEKDVFGLVRSENNN